jgi:ferrous iron transport protein B
MSQRSTYTVALIGNPNTGKSTLFSALAGVRQRVGNYPGVTVEKKVGSMPLGNGRCELIDLPGTYSLAPRSPDEMVAVDVLLHRRADVQQVDAVLSIVDASNLERNLYLVSQVLELGLPIVIALNMVDVAKTRGLKIDLEKLRRQLGVPVIEVQANKRIGLENLKQALSAALAGGSQREVDSPFPAEFQQETARLQKAWEGVARSVSANHAATAVSAERNSRLPRYLAERLLLDTSGYLQGTLADGHGNGIFEELPAARRRLVDAGIPIPAIEAQARYGWVGEVLTGVVERPAQRVVTSGDRVDRFLTHKVWGTAVFALMMLVVFSSVFIFADPLMGMIDEFIGGIGDWVSARMPEGPLQSLVVDGVIGGVVQLCLRHSWRHGDARHRKPPRPVDDDPRGAADELQRPATGVCDPDWRVHPGDELVRLPAVAGADVVLDVLVGNPYGRGRRPRSQTHAAAWADAAIRDGTARI